MQADLSICDLANYDVSIGSDPVEPKGITSSCKANGKNSLKWGFDRNSVDFLANLVKRKDKALAAEVYEISTHAQPLAAFWYCLLHPFATPIG
ncbi:MAG: hypothetical protein M3Q07_11885 [Pseudobdellovibrionaceae bacterium]|nr:hypothetical protein [Pseudobdellovibrionaceae bacterium]